MDTILDENQFFKEGPKDSSEETEIKEKLCHTAKLVLLFGSFLEFYEVLKGMLNNLELFFRTCEEAQYENVFIEKQIEGSRVEVAMQIKYSSKDEHKATKILSKSKFFKLSNPTELPTGKNQVWQNFGRKNFLQELLSKFVSFCYCIFNLYNRKL